MILPHEHLFLNRSKPRKQRVPIVNRDSLPSFPSVPIRSRGDPPSSLEFPIPLTIILLTSPCLIPERERGRERGRFRALPHCSFTGHVMADVSHSVTFTTRRPDRKRLPRRSAPLGLLRLAAPTHAPASPAPSIYNLSFIIHHFPTILSLPHDFAPHDVAFEAF